MASDPNSLLIFKMRGMSSESPKTPKPVVAPHREEEQKPMPAVAVVKPKVKPEEQEASIYYKVGGDYPNPMKYYKEALKENAEGREIPMQEAPRGRADSRIKARDLFCALHPFRHAYAVCTYCHRPFCFEDIIEYQKGYYCVEDIDRVESQRTERLTYEYSSANLITAFIMIGAFVLFLYYTNAQLGYIFGYIISDPIGFINNINFNISYIASLVTLGAMVVTFVAALYSLVGSREGHIFLAACSMLTVVLFVYQYIGTQTQYFVIIAAFEFLAFLSSVRSAASSAQVYSQVYEKGSEYTLAYGYGARY